MIFIIYKIAKNKLCTRSSLFWDVTQPRLIVTDVSGRTLRSFSRVNPKRRSLTTNLLCLTCQKREVLTYKAAEPRNHARLY